MPPDLPIERCALYVRKEEIPRAARTALLHQPHSMFAPAFFNLWISPCGYTYSKRVVNLSA